MDGGALQNLVGFLRERRGQAGIVYCHKVGNFLGYGASAAAAACDLCGSVGVTSVVVVDAVVIIGK